MGPRQLFFGGGGANVPLPSHIAATESHHLGLLPKDPQIAYPCLLLPRVNTTQNFTTQCNVSQYWPCTSDIKATMMLHGWHGFN